MQVIKRDGRKASFSKENIKNAILKAFESVDGEVTNYAKEKARDIANFIESFNRDMTVEEIQDEIENKLMASNRKDVARAYIIYRNERTKARGNTTDIDIEELLDGENDYWNTENSNKNPREVTTQRDYIAGVTSTDITMRKLLPPDIVEAHNEGIIHFHDADYFAQKSLNNCCLINLEDMLQNGTVVNGYMIEKPHRFLTACTIATQIILGVSSSQYGGCTISAAHLAPFVKDSYNIFLKKYKDFGLDNETAKKLADIDLRKEVDAGVQTFNYQVNSMTNTNGQSPFLSVCLYLGETEEYKKELAMVIEEFLKQRIQGFKNPQGIWITPAFPKLLYVLEEDNIHEDSPYWYLTVLSAKCSAKRLVPDYISEKIMLELKGDAYPCMGCVEGAEIITYRFNNELYVESFERMWNRLSDYHIPQRQNLISNNLFMDVDNVEIYDTEKGFVDVYRVIRNQSNNWRDVQLTNGRRIRCTNDHPFEVKGKGIIRAEDLSENDVIMINPKQYSDNKLFFDSDKAWLLGFLLCDGCYSNGHIFASIAITGEDDIQDNFIKAVKKSFGLDTKIVEQHRGKKGNYKDLYVLTDGTDKLQNSIMYLNNKFEGSNKKNRHIPNEVFSWTVDAQLSFLAGMIDADGYIKYNNFGSVVQIGSTNKELALQQMALAQTLGMPARMYYNYYRNNNKQCIRYRIEFYPNNDLIEKLSCQKKINNYVESDHIGFECYSKVMSVTPIEMDAYSYDVTTASEHFEVSGIYSHNCRSFLTPDRFTKQFGNIAKSKNYNGKNQYYGRFNQGVVTINLADIALSSGKDFDKFWKLFEERTELCHKALRIRHERLKSITSDAAPLLWQHGAFARLDKGESVSELLYHGYSTISLGYAALYECVKYMTDHSHTDEIGKKFAMEVMQALNDKCNQWKADEDIDYSIYGSPIESVTYKFAKCLKNRFGTIEGITDHDYITNSYHINVREEINAFDKLAKEAEFQKLSPGGAISYVETANLTNNIEAVLSVIKYIYDHIMYAELNTKSDYCQCCGFSGEIQVKEDENKKLYWECPQCGNHDETKLNVARRTCGYIGSQFWNQGRTQEIRDRVLHL